MRPLVVAISLSAFVLHFVVGCAAHAHAEGSTCNAGQTTDATTHHEGHHHHGTSDPVDHEPSIPDHDPHESDCVFAATAKVEMAKQWCVAAALNLCLTDSVPELVCAAREKRERSSAPRFATLRSHLVKSVLLI